MFFKIYRIFFIFYVFVKYNLFELIIYNKKNNFIKFICFINFFIFKKNVYLSLGNRLKLFFENLGPVFIKFGQILSMRIDFVPHEIVSELVDLQNKVFPFCGVVAKKSIEKSFGVSINSLFKFFDVIPVASASVAQIHRALLFNGKEVAIKILRPNIIYDVKRDIDLLLFLVYFFGKFFFKKKSKNIYNLILEIKYILLNELNLNIEAANACKMKKNFMYSKILIIPNVYWELTKNNILTMDFVYGVSINNIRELNKCGFDLELIAKMCIQLFFIQVFRDNYFHADMHPGNILISNSFVLYPKIILLDYGIVGFISFKDQKYMGENILSFIKRDYRRVAELHILSGCIPDYVSLNELEQAICSVWEPIFNKELRDISFEKTFRSLLDISKNFNMKIQPQLLLFQKTLFSVEGLTRYLYPKINFWKITRPILEKWFFNQFNFNKFLFSIKSFTSFWLSNILDDKIYNISNLNVKNIEKIEKIEKNYVFYIFFFIFLLLFFILFYFKNVFIDFILYVFK